MAESPHGSVFYTPLSLYPDLDDTLQSAPQSDFHESHSLQRPNTESLGRLTPQFNWPFAEDPLGLPLSGSEVPQMSHSLAAPTQAQKSFIHLTSILKDSFLEESTPSPSERLRLAACTGLDRSDVSAWFDIIRSLTIEVGVDSIPKLNIAQASVSELFTNRNPPWNSARPSRPLRTRETNRQRRPSTAYSGPSKRRQIEDVSQDKGSLRNLDNSQQQVSRRRPTKPLREGPYCCPSTACKFSTMNLDQWYTHQSRKHFPSEVFVCGINSGTKPCNKGPDDPCKRKDNFATHLKESHGYEPGHALDQEISKSTVKVTGLFHDRCGFCSETLDTRQASIEHIGDHIKTGDKIADWTHRCTSLEHTLQHHVHFDLDRPKTDDKDSENFGGLSQKGDNDHGDGVNTFNWGPCSNTHQGFTFPLDCASPSREYTSRNHCPSRTPLSSFAKSTRSYSEQRVKSSVVSWSYSYESDSMYHDSESCGLLEPPRTSSFRRERIMGTKLQDRYERESFRRGASRAHSSRHVRSMSSWRREDRYEIATRLGRV